MLKFVDLVRCIRSSTFGRCVYEKALKQYHKIVQPYRCWRLRRHGGELLAALHAVLDGVGIEYYLYWGSLLGAVRERDFIRSDDDIDIMVNRVDFSKHIASLFAALKAKGFVFSHLVKTESMILCATFAYKGIHVDFFGFDVDSDGSGIRFVWVYDKPGTKYANANQCSTHSLKLPTCRPGQLIDFKGVKIMVPSCVEKTLECAYGKDWRVPKSGWKTPSDYYTELPDIAERFTNIGELLPKVNS